MVTSKGEKRQASTAQLRITGAIVGVSLATVAAAVSEWLTLYWSTFQLAPLPEIGMAVGVVLGFIVGPEVARTEHPGRSALLLAGNAVLLGLAAFALVSAVTFGWGDSSGVAGYLFFMVYAVPAAFVYGLPVAAPVAFIGVAIMRMGRLRLAGVVTAVLLAAVFGLLAGASPALNLAARVPGSSVELRWTVANYSARSLELGIFERHGSGGDFGGSIAGIGPCFTTTGTENVGIDWFLTLDPYSTEPTPPELISAADAPDSSVAVWMTVKANGTALVEVGRTATAEQLTVDHCLEVEQR